MSGLVREEITHSAYDCIEEEKQEGCLLYEDKGKTYLTSSVETRYETEKGKWVDRYFATRLDLEQLTAGEALKITLHEIENLKKALKQSLKGI